MTPELTPDPADRALHADLLAEIAHEAARRRGSGEVPADLEDQLDRLFDALVPDPAGQRDFGSALERAERDALIDVDPPTDSDRAAFEPVKRGVKKLVLWYMDYVVGQVVTLGGSLVRALRLLGERVDRLDARVTELAGAQAELRGAVLDAVDLPHHAPLPPALPTHWVERLVEELCEAAGRVLHADCGDGEVVLRLAAAGVDAYGVGAAAPTEAGVSLRADSPLDHLRVVGDGRLAAVAVSGFVDGQARSHQVETAGHLGRVIVPGGRILLVGTAPGAWAAGRPATEVDLAPGRPLHAETWCALLGAAGFSSVAIADADEASGTYLVTGVR